MFPRLRNFSHKHRFFLFGPRGTGKSTLLKQRFDQKNCLWLDLLDSNIEEQFSYNPNNFSRKNLIMLHPILGNSGLLECFLEIETKVKRPQDTFKMKSYI